MTNAVGGRQPNAWGLNDMHRSLWQWCQDWYDKDYYAKSPADDPTGPLGGSQRVYRGGSWGEPLEACRSAFRSKSAPWGRRNVVGFRVSLILPDTVMSGATE